MERVPLIVDRNGLDAEGQAAFDGITESRGELLRPFQVLLHTPKMAARVAELGHEIRFGSRLADRDRELVTVAAGRALGCRFVWESHLEAAREAGLAEAELEALDGATDDLGDRDRTLVSFARELCVAGTVSDGTFAEANELLGIAGTVELSLTVGYYAMLASVMRACEAC